MKYINMKVWGCIFMTCEACQVHVCILVITTSFIPPPPPPPTTNRMHWTHWLPKSRWPGLNGTQSLRSLITTRFKLCLHSDVLCQKAPPPTPEHSPTYVFLCPFLFQCKSYTHSSSCAGHAKATVIIMSHHICSISQH